MSERALDVARPRPGRIICAGADDIARALASLRAGGCDPLEFGTAATAALPEVEAIRRLEGLSAGVEGAGGASLLSDGPVGLLTGADMPARVIVDAILAQMGRGVIWKPSPKAAASAHLLVRHIGPVSAGGLAMLQGDHATGAALAALVPTLWLSDQAVPDGLPVTPIRGTRR